MASEPPGGRHFGSPFVAVADIPPFPNGCADQMCYISGRRRLLQIAFVITFAAYACAMSYGVFDALFRGNQSSQQWLLFFSLLSPATVYCMFRKDSRSFLRASYCIRRTPNAFVFHSLLGREEILPLGQLKSLRVLGNHVVMHLTDASQDESLHAYRIDEIEEFKKMHGLAVQQKMVK